MADKLSKILDQVAAADLQLDDHGRIVIDNPKLAEQLKEIVSAAGGETAHNYGCSTNAAACGKSQLNPEDLVSLQRRLVGG